jgi:hypothetical protein
LLLRNLEVLAEVKESMNTPTTLGSDLTVVFSIPNFRSNYSVEKCRIPRSNWKIVDGMV